MRKRTKLWVDPFPTAAAAKKKNDDKLAQDKANLAESKHVQEKAQDILDNADAGDLRGSKELGLLGIKDKYALAQDTIETEGRRQAAIKHSISQEEGKKEGLDKTAAATQSDYAALQAKYDAKVKEDAARKAQLDDLAAQKAGKGATAETLESLHNQTAEAKATANDQAAQVTKAERDADAALANANNGSRGAAINRLAASHDTLVNFVNQHADLADQDRQELSRRLQETDRKIAQLQSRLNSNRNL